MLEYFRQKCIEQMPWNGHEKGIPKTYLAKTLECWRFERISTAEEHMNYRSLTLNLRPATTTEESVSEELHSWLHLEDPYMPLSSPANSSVASGGIRIICCDRYDMAFGIGLRKPDFEAIECAFKLHTTVLPTLSVRAGTHGIFYERSPTSDDAESVSIVLKTPQRNDICNYTVSIHHDSSTGWTNAFICGAGIITPRAGQAPLPGQFAQIKDIILTNPDLWDNPLFLAFVILQDHSLRVDQRAGLIISEVSGLESRIGITNAAITKNEFDQIKWPLQFDPKTVTISLHSLATRLQNLSLSFQWSQRYASALLTACEELRDLPFCAKYKRELWRMKQHVEFIRTTTQNRQARAAAFEHRANLQINVLHNMISQQDSLVNRQDASLNFRIAKSSKQDSVSVSTFTFITALFLPGTFVATLFSMTMFDWQINREPSDSSTNSLQEPVQRLSYVSDKFWIFWVVTVPLTIITMTTWYFWSKFSNRQWLEELRNESEQDRLVSGFTTTMTPSSSFYQPFPNSDKLQKDVF